MNVDFLNPDKIFKNKFFNLFTHLGILLLIILIGFFVYFTGGTTSFVHLMYIPILISVFFFGIRVGIITSIIAGLILGPYMPMVVEKGIMQETTSWVFRIIMFITIVTFVGLLFRYIKAINEAERRRAYIDVITGYPNSTKLIEDLNMIIREEKHQTLSLIVFEYKNREMINQYVDHDVGNKSFIGLLNNANNFFNSCNIYTVSTNKFIIIIPDYDYNNAYNLANEFTVKTKEPMYIDTLPISLIVKGGIVNYPMHSNEISDIILKLDKVLGQSTKTQKNITIYDNNMETESIKYYNTLVSLYYSLQNDMFHLVYQPKISLKNNEIVGAEALLRIKYNSYNNLSIAQLIGIAEDVGFINEITNWVINNSVKQIKTWQNDNIFTNISINLSSLDLNDDAIVYFVMNCLKSNGVDSSMLEFELTERSIIDDEQRVSAVLNKIKNEGIKISLDDYGSGHNSLNYLVNALFPFDYIKIDKSFIDNIEIEQNEVLIQGVIETAHVLGIEVVAEGVETNEQMEILKKIGCDIVQGYYISKPLSPEDFAKYIKVHAKA